MSLTPRSGSFRVEIPDPPGGVRTDLSAWPVVVVMPPSTPMNDADYRAYLEWTRRYIVCTGQPYAMVIDNRNVAPITANQRKLLSDHMQSTRPFSQKFCAGAAMVFDSAVMRGIMTALFWLSQPPYVVKVFATLEEGRSWCKQRVDGFAIGSNDGVVQSRDVG